MSDSYCDNVEDKFLLYYFGILKDIIEFDFPIMGVVY